MSNKSMRCINSFLYDIEYLFKDYSEAIANIANIKYITDLSQLNNKASSIDEKVYIKLDNFINSFKKTLLEKGI